MSDNSIIRKEAVRQLLDLNDKVSHNLQSIMLLLLDSQNIAGKNVPLLAYQTDEAITNYARFRACSYSIIGLDEE